MRALTILEPYASLIAHGQKHIETRSWPAPRDVIGQRIAIHAGKRFTADDLAWLCDVPDALVALTDAGLDIDRGSAARSFRSTRGKVIATATLAACVRFDPEMIQRIGNHYGEQELRYGGFAAGRFGFVLADVIRLAEPIPATGALGLWEFDPPAMEDAA